MAANLARWRMDSCEESYEDTEAHETSHGRSVEPKQSAGTGRAVDSGAVPTDSWQNIREVTRFTVRMKIGVLTLVLSLLHPLCQAQDREASAVLTVHLPASIAKLWEPELTHINYFAGSELLGGTDAIVDGSFTIESPRAKEIDRLLLLGGSRARWARRGTGDAFLWDDSGYVVAGRLPPDLGPNFHDAVRPLNCWIDMLGPADGAVPDGVASLYPATRMDDTWDESFLVGVPGPGRWTVIVHVSGGLGDLLVTCPAMREGEVPARLPAVEAVAFRCMVRFDLTSLPAAEREPRDAECLASTRSGASRNGTQQLMRSEAGGPSHWSAEADDLVSILWIWRPGWEVQRVDGSEFTTPATVVDRTVLPAKALNVEVRLETGEPAVDASVKLSNASGSPVPAAGCSGSDSSAARLWWGGHTGPDPSMPTCLRQPSTQGLV
ncbi:MAG TPA: hypothetical protein VFY71_07450 [Planctomycetota bacterium]|nr:hypothetical protein [Planctomycetota bacterium]